MYFGLYLLKEYLVRRTPEYGTSLTGTPGIRTGAIRR